MELLLIVILVLFSILEIEACSLPNQLVSQTRLGFHVASKLTRGQALCFEDDKSQVQLKFLGIELDYPIVEEYKFYIPKIETTCRLTSVKIAEYFNFQRQFLTNRSREEKTSSLIWQNEPCRMFYENKKTRENRNCTEIIKKSWMVNSDCQACCASKVQASSKIFTAFRLAHRPKVVAFFNLNISTNHSTVVDANFRLTESSHHIINTDSLLSLSIDREAVISNHAIWEGKWLLMQDHKLTSLKSDKYINGLHEWSVNKLGWLRPQEATGKFLQASNETIARFVHVDVSRCNAENEGDFRANFHGAIDVRPEMLAQVNLDHMENLKHRPQFHIFSQRLNQADNRLPVNAFVKGAGGSNNWQPLIRSEEENANDDEGRLKFKAEILIGSRRDETRLRINLTNLCADAQISGHVTSITDKQTRFHVVEHFSQFVKGGAAASRNETDVPPGSSHVKREHFNCGKSQVDVRLTKRYTLRTKAKICIFRLKQQHFSPTTKIICSERPISVTRHQRQSSFVEPWPPTIKPLDVVVLQQEQHHYGTRETIENWMRRAGILNWFKELTSYPTNIFVAVKLIAACFILGLLLKLASCCNCKKRS